MSKGIQFVVFRPQREAVGIFAGRLAVQPGYVGAAVPYHVAVDCFGAALRVDQPRRAWAHEAERDGKPRFVDRGCRADQRVAAVREKRRPSHEAQSDAR